MKHSAREAKVALVALASLMSLETLRYIPLYTIDALVTQVYTYSIIQ